VPPLPVEPPGPISSPLQELGPAPPPPPEPTAPEPAPPEAALAFGSPGQWVIMSTSSGVGISYETFSASKAAFFSANFGIGVDRFIARNVSLGIDVEGSYGDSKGYGATSFNDIWSTHFAAAFGVGVNVPLAHQWSWYPRGLLGLESSHTNTAPIDEFNGAPFPPSSSTSSVGPWVYLYAPLLFHPAPHFFAGVGPRITRNFGVLHGGPYDGSQTTLLTAEFAMGGWWGGSPETASPADAPPIAPRFGERGQVVFTTTATEASIGFFGYSQSTASTLSESIAPGFDIFVTDHLSLGLNVALSHSSGTSFDASGAKTDSSETSYRIGPRVGFDIRLPGALSLWPQAELGFGGGTSTQTSSAGSNDHTFKQTSVQASIPLLVHPAAHFFLGAGPYAFHDLSNADQNNFENDGTTFGASFLLGGWL
jgi:hypothetical protein